jgi:hypothetical protein
MKSLIVAVYDKKAQFFDKPVLTQNQETAIRMITTTVTNPDAQGLQMVKTPEDFALYELGTFDDNRGFIDAENSPIHITDVIHCFPNNNPSEE